MSHPDLPGVRYPSPTAQRAERAFGPARVSPNAHLARCRGRGRWRGPGGPATGWNGIVDCEVLEVDEPRLLRYSWVGGDGGGDVTQVAYRLEPRADGTRFTYDHTGFTGVSGLFMSTLLGRVRTKMLDKGLPPVLDDLDDDGKLR
ncbi:MAG: SRPBCC family protein [Trebonia sp.]